MGITYYLIIILFYTFSSVTKLWSLYLKTEKSIFHLSTQHQTLLRFPYFYHYFNSYRLLNLKNISKSFNGTKAVSDLSFSVDKGETLICFEAIEQGEIDIYPEYTGTGLTAILKVDNPPGDPITSYRKG